MSNIIQLLERMGQDASLREVRNTVDVINEADISEELKVSLLEGDTTKLERDLDICPDIVCIVFPAEDDEPSKDDEPSEDSPSEEEIRTVMNG